MKMSKIHVSPILFFVLVGCALATENYMDYGGMSEDGEKSAAENVHELYRLLLQRNALENAAFGGVPLEHLMIRKSQRSPSLRLRFGRSDPRLSMGVLARPMGAVATGFEDNN